MSSSASAADLPAGWQEMIDKAGRKYYYNSSTKETKWKKPTAVDAAASGSAGSGSSGQAAASSSPITLSPDWEEKKDNSGKTYFYNKKTRETSWKRPEQPAAAVTDSSGSALPPDWEEKKDNAGRLYYYNKKTKETKWKKPTASAASTPPAEEGALPPEWEEKKDNSGKTYFYNKKTRETSWKRPVSSTASSAASSALPPDWEEKKDNSGKTYFYNKKTRETSWKRPEQPAAAVADSSGSALPPDWEEKKDNAGRVYYYNKKTKETKWKKPTASAASTPPAEEGALPPDWEEKKDNSGKAYFYNKKTRETSWKRPTSAAAAAPSSSVLPPDWEEKKDSSGKTYFYNKKTRETSWKRPDQPAAAVADSSALQRKEPQGAPATALASSRPLAELGPVPYLFQPDGTHASVSVFDEDNDEYGDIRSISGDWMEKKETGSDRIYYYNKRTRETTIRRPYAVMYTMNKVDLASLISKRQFIPESVLLCQGDWTKKLDGKTGVGYYYNTKTGENRWGDPQSGETTRLLRLGSVNVTPFLLGGQMRSEATDEERQRVLCFTGNVWAEAPISLPRPLDEPHCVPIAPHYTEQRCLLFGTERESGQALCYEYAPDAGIVEHPHYAREAPLRHGCAISAVSHGVLFTGGFENELKTEVSSAVSLLDTSIGKYHTLPQLRNARASHCLAVVDLSSPVRVLWFCYVVGGFDGKKKTSSVERYVLGSPEWETMSSLGTPRAGHSCVVIDRSIYCIGGRSGYHTVNTGEVMHTQTDLWSPIAPMRQPRCNFGAGVVNEQYIYVIGGWTGTDWLSTVEAYDVKMDLWRDVATLPGPLSSPAVALLTLPTRDPYSSDAMLTDGDTQGEGEGPQGEGAATTA